MEQQIHISYLGLVRNVIGCREETVKAAPGTTIGELLQFLVVKHGDSFQQSVLRKGGELRSTAQVYLNDCDISEQQGLATQIGNGEQVSIVVGVYPPEGG
jgi:molybdopterin converting factor small subunit